MNTPVQVYLDSKDISRMADREKGEGDSAASELFEYLVSRVDAGDIQVRLSALLVGELVQRAPEYKDAGLRRARTAKRLCRGNALKFYEDVIAAEMVSYVDNCGRPSKSACQKYAFDDCGMWAPALSREDLNVLEILNKELSAALDEVSMPRQQRNALLRKIKRANGTFTDYGLNLIKSGREKLMTHLESQFPLTDRVWKDDMFYGLVKGEISEDELARELMRGISDVENLAGWIYSKYPDAQRVSRILLDGGEPIINAIADARIQFNDLIERSSVLGLDDKEVLARAKEWFNFSKLRTRIISAKVDQYKKKFYKHGGPRRCGEILIASPVGGLPFLDCAFSTIFEFAFDRSTQTKNPAKLSPSDYVDAMHCGYMPFVDVFSCDKRTINYARGVAKNFDVTLVHKFENIKGAIEGKVNAKITPQTAPTPVIPSGSPQ